jgi:uncharacterized protein YndB with AHSA1/START domain
MSNTQTAAKILGIGFEPPDRLVIAWADDEGTEHRLALPAQDATQLVAGLMSAATVAPEALRQAMQEAAGKVELHTDEPIRPQGLAVGVGHRGKVSLTFRTGEKGEFTFLVPISHATRLREEIKKAEEMAAEEASTSSPTRH